ncbi:MAG: hypothetical protein J0L61_11370, partial [Planctomycetes bacterium]|nr:hypothetical protein [Planctomycetota bacterium]
MALSATGPAISAAPVVFENTTPGFAWQQADSCLMPQIGARLFLDITQPANAQQLSDDTYNNCNQAPRTVVIRLDHFGSPTQPYYLSVSGVMAYSAPFSFQLFLPPAAPSSV